MPLTVDADPEVTVQNIVTSADLGDNLNLNAIAIGFGLENIEYEPEQFPGLVSELGLSPSVEQRARALLEEAKTQAVHGAKPAGVAGGAILVALSELGDSEAIRQTDVADVAGVCIPTVRRHRNELRTV